MEHYEYEPDTSDSTTQVSESLAGSPKSQAQFQTVTDIDDESAHSSSPSVTVRSPDIIDDSNNIQDQPDKDDPVFHRYGDSNVNEFSGNSPYPTDSTIMEETKKEEEDVLTPNTVSDLALPSSVMNDTIAVEQQTLSTIETGNESESTTQHRMDEKESTHRINDQDESVPSDSLEHGFSHSNEHNLNTSSTSELGNTNNHEPQNKSSPKSDLDSRDMQPQSPNQSPMSEHPKPADSVPTNPDLDSDSEEFFDCEETLITDDTDPDLSDTACEREFDLNFELESNFDFDFDSDPDSGSNPNPNPNPDDNNDNSTYQNFAPTNYFWQGKEDHKRARNHTRNLIHNRAKPIGNNGPHGPHGEPYRTSRETAFAIDNFKEIQARSHITTALYRLLVNIQSRKFDVAEVEAREALKVAMELNQEPTIARCHYWFGVIEYFRGDHEKAHQYFLDARPCGDEYPTEGRDLNFFLSLFQRGVPSEDREEVLLTYSKSLPSKSGQKAGIPTSNKLKRKRGFAESEPILVSAPRQQHRPNAIRQRRYQGYNKSQTPAFVRRIWYSKYDTEDTKPRPSESKSPNKPADDNNTNNNNHSRLGKLVPNADLAWAAKTVPNTILAYILSSIPDYEEIPRSGRFEFVMYPKGLAPRTRSTINVAEQPWEFIIPREKWESVQEAVSDKEVTMGYLRRERVRFNRRYQAKLMASEMQVSADDAKDKDSACESSSPDEGSRQRDGCMSEFLSSSANNVELENEAGVKASDTNKSHDDVNTTEAAESDGDHGDDGNSLSPKDSQEANANARTDESLS